MRASESILYIVTRTSASRLISLVTFSVCCVYRESETDKQAPRHILKHCVRETYRETQTDMREIIVFVSSYIYRQVAALAYVLGIAPDTDKTRSFKNFRTLKAVENQANS